MNEIASRLTQVRQRIATTAQQFGRSSNAVQLVAVTKTRTLAELRLAIAAGQISFAENYLQEALTKITVLEAENNNLTWHFIGTIQSNKTSALARHFHWVQSVTRWKIAQRLNEQRPSHSPPLNICLEVNVSQETTKAGVSLAELPALALAITRLPRLRLRGLMAIPAPSQDFAQQRLPYRQLHEAFLSLQQQGLPLDTLSIGMSADLEAAIAEGSTLVRVGTAIFGERPGK